MPCLYVGVAWRFSCLLVSSNIQDLDLPSTKVEHNMLQTISKTTKQDIFKHEFLSLMPWSICLSRCNNNSLSLLSRRKSAVLWSLCLCWSAFALIIASVLLTRGCLARSCSLACTALNWPDIGSTRHTHTELHAEVMTIEGGTKRRRSKIWKKRRTTNLI